MVLKVSLNTGINRIRLEFKDVIWIVKKKSGKSINRIRLEFKDNTTGFLARNPMVLIESDWNLKDEELKELTQLIRY